MSEVTILLGSNVFPEINIPRALMLLQQAGRIVRASHLWETSPIACKVGGRFHNALIVLESPASHTVWVTQIVPAIEDALGRVRDPLDKCAPRTIDLDLLEVPHGIEKLPFIPQLIAESYGEDPAPGKDMVRIMSREQLISEFRSSAHDVKSSKEPTTL